MPDVSSSGNMVVREEKPIDINNFVWDKQEPSWDKRVPFLGQTGTPPWDKSAVFCFIPQ